MEWLSNLLAGIDGHRPRGAAAMTERNWLTAALVALATGVTAAVVLGPLVTGRLAYRTSDLALDQIVGGELAALAVVVPVTLVAAFLVARGHRAGPVIALAPSTWALYMYAQLILGQEYLDLPGNNERFFPLLLALFVLGGIVFVLAWQSVAAAPLPAVGRRLERTAGIALLVVAAFLTLGLHLPSLLDALGDQPGIEYTANPTAFWVVKLMDLGIVVPSALAIGVGLLRGAARARRAAYAILGGYTLLGAAVAGMAIVMYVNGAPDASLANVAAFSAFAAVFGWITVALYRPLFMGDGATDRHDQRRHGAVGLRGNARARP